MSEFIAESVVAERLGISRERLREFRKENMYLHEHFESGHQIDLTEKGVEMVEEAFGLESVPEGVFAEKRGERVECVGEVCRIFGINRRLIEVEFEKRPPVRVKVRDNRKFVIGQEVPVRGVAGEAVWRLNCPQPRSRGRLRWKR